MVLLRRLLGEVLRGHRQRQSRTLREVSGTARVSLGYLSEIERGHKEASSELLAAICSALDVPQAQVLREVSDRLAGAERMPQRPHRAALARPASQSAAAALPALPEAEPVLVAAAPAGPDAVSAA